MPFGILTIIVLGGFLAWAILTDLSARRIPNALVLLGGALAVGIHGLALWLSAEPLAGAAWWHSAAGLLTGLAVMLPLHLLRAMGAGDVKLMAMVGAFIGPTPVLVATLYTLLAGGLLSLAFMLGHGVAAQTLGNIRAILCDWTTRFGSGQGLRLAPLEHTAVRLPYALAIAVGTASSLLWPLSSP